MSSADSSIEGMPTWDLMLPDLLGRCFNGLPDRDRCRVIPMVCRAFRDSHLSHPPQPKSWTTYKPLSHSLVQWFLRICHQVERLELAVPDKPTWLRVPAKDSCLLLHMLESADLPKLHTLQLSGSWAPHASVPQLLGTAPLGRLHKLSLEGWLITKESSVQDFQSLSCLQSLTSLDLKWEGFQNVAAYQADAMWDALATLRDLQSLSLSPLKRYLGGARDKKLVYGSKPFFFELLTSVSQISHLSINDVDICMDEDDLLHPSFEHLTQLTSLSLTGKCANFCFEPVNLLTQLEKVWLEADDKESSSIFGETEGPPMDLAPLCRLTDLGLDGWTGWEIEEILPPTLPALAKLKRLTLCQMELEYFSVTSCKALQCLIYLDLSYNSFEGFPYEVRGITTLIHLNLSGNFPMRLTDDDVHTLRSMRKAGLEKLDIDDIPQLLEHEYDLSPESSRAFQTLWWGGVCC